MTKITDTISGEYFAGWMNGYRAGLERKAVLVELPRRRPGMGLIYAASAAALALMLFLTWAGPAL